MRSETTSLFSTHIFGNTSTTFHPDPYTNTNHHKTRTPIPMLISSTLIPQPFESTLLKTRLLRAKPTTTTTAQTQTQIQTKISIQSELITLFLNSTPAQQTIALLLRCVLCFATPIITLSRFSSLNELCSGSLAMVVANAAYFAVIQGCVYSLAGPNSAGVHEAIVAWQVEVGVGRDGRDNDDDDDGGEYGAKVGALCLMGFMGIVIMLIPMISICWFFENLVESLFALPLSSSLSWMSGEGLFHDVQSCLQVLSLGLPGLVAFELCDWFLLLVHHQQFFSIWILIVVVPLNSVLSYLFVYVFDLGLIGAPLALSLSFWIMGLGSLAYVLLFVDGLQCWKGFAKKVTFSRTDLLRRLSLAVGAVVSVEIEYFVFELMIFTALSFGKVQFAVLTLCSVIASLAAQVSYAFGCAVSIRVNQLIGLGDKNDSAKSALYCMIFAEILGVFNFFSLFIFKKTIVSIFTNDEELTHELYQVLPYVFALQLFDSLNVTCVGLLRSQRKEVIGSVVHFVAYFVICLPLTYFLAFVLHYKVIWLWIGLNLTVFLLISFEAPLVLIIDWDKALRIASQQEDQVCNLSFY
ncbi:unnamed protein product [Ambrosiozyma monospora]|uniref:Unnamed protein product n=1 Tax=Ambrosiozyma monospora TaxID=43982 RepID=A0A9W6Z2E1_AMBMO|nr:unnamed protein product [Ambrosiozyma monospora]